MKSSQSLDLYLLMTLQTCMTVFYARQRGLLDKMLVAGVCCFDWTLLLLHGQKQFVKITYFGRKSVIHVWNKMKVRTWVNNPFKKTYCKGQFHVIFFLKETMVASSIVTNIVKQMEISPNHNSSKHS